MSPEISPATRHRTHPTAPGTDWDAELRTVAPSPEDDATDTFDLFSELAGHDLRSPLAAVFGALKTLEPHVAEDPFARDIVALGLSGAGRLERMLDELLAYARAGDGGRHGAVALDELVEGAARATDGVTVEHDGLPLIVGDRTLLEHMFGNLFANAAKHARLDGPPHVTVTAACRDDRAHVTVGDDGPGIPASERARLLRPFERAGTTSGSGLGLAIVARIAAAHGGRATIDESPTGGAAFHFSLPLAAGPASSG